MCFFFDKLFVIADKSAEISSLKSCTANLDDWRTLYRRRPLDCFARTAFNRSLATRICCLRATLINPESVLNKKCVLKISLKCSNFILRFFVWYDRGRPGDLIYSSSSDRQSAAQEPLLASCAFSSISESNSLSATFAAPARKFRNPIYSLLTFK